VDKYSEQLGDELRAVAVPPQLLFPTEAQVRAASRVSAIYPAYLSTQSL
jgi:hypothetical protein